jgi:hypothetical protein
MNRRAAIRKLFGAAAVIAISPQILAEIGQQEATVAASKISLEEVFYTAVIRGDQAYNAPMIGSWYGVRIVEATHPWVEQL